MRMLHNLVILLPLFVLTACGGSSDDNDNVTPPAADALPGGYYTGTLTQAGKNQDVEGLVLEDGYALFISADGIYAGQLAIEGEGFENSFKAFAFAGMTWDGSNTVLTGTIKGTVKSRNMLAGEYTLGDATGKINMAYGKELYELGASVDHLVGDWGYTIGSYQLNVTFSEDGSYHGQDTTGCTLAGKWSVPDETYNGYRISEGTISCGYGSTVFTGAAMSYEEPAVESDVLVIGMHNARYAYVDILIRQ